jgi:microcompartment protein CcmK/EutM
MDVGEVLGTVKCSITVPWLENSHFKAVRVYKKGQAAQISVAAGAVEAGNGEFVYLVTGQEASKAFGSLPRAVDYAVIGRVDDVCLGPR